MLNEFREDLVSGEWVLFATGRAKRDGAVQKRAKVVQSKKDCPFEDPEKSGNEILATYHNKDKTDWTIKVAKNKFPAVLEGQVSPMRKEGCFNMMDARGRHEIIIFREHERALARFSADELAEVFRVYQERYSSMLDHGLIKYILLFHNQGPGAGATVQHPHSQIMSIPILPPDVRRSVVGSERFFRDNHEKVYDVMIKWEMQSGKRIIYENEHFVVFCPCVSKTPYEVRIFPKNGEAHFEKTPPEMLFGLGDAMRVALNKIRNALDDPDYNFFIHTAPLDGDSGTVHDFYTWHIEILPQTTILGGFDLGSGIDVNIIDPDEAAKLFRETEI